MCSTLRKLSDLNTLQEFNDEKEYVELSGEKRNVHVFLSLMLFS